MSEKHDCSCGCGCSAPKHAEIETCGCCHCHGPEEKKQIAPIVMTVVGALLIGASFLPFWGETVPKLMQIAAIIICGFPVFADAVKAVTKLKINESLLLVIAVVAACFIGEFFEAAVVAVLFRVGELMEDYASNRSRKSIEAIFSIVSDEATLVLSDGTLKKIDADEVEIDDLLAVLPHEIFPVDGVVTDGAGSVDASALTGESVPIPIEKGSSVSGGMVNGNSTVYIRATTVKTESYASRIVKMVEEAAQKKGESQRAISVFAKYYTPAVIAAAILVAVIPSVISGDWQSWIYRSLILLVASCPCAVVLSAPLAFFSSMGAAAKNGMILKGSRYIEALAKADTVVFDKTGTLTTGELKTGNVYTCDGYSAKDVISLAAKCEYNSTHPIAKAIVAQNNGADTEGVCDFSEFAGGGTSVTAPKGKIMCGGERMMKEYLVDISDFPNAPVYVALNGIAIGAICVDGELRSSAPQVVKKLRMLGVEHSFVLTGDNAEQTRKVCSQCDIDDFRSGLLPEDKLNALEEIKENSKGVIYVGDGINDAPVLAAADVGIAMGLGTQAACEAADVILTDSQISRLAETVHHSKRTMAVLKANIAFAIAVKFIVIALGIIGIAPMWSAIIADVGTMIICVANSARLMSIKK